MINFYALRCAISSMILTRRKFIKDVTLSGLLISAFPLAAKARQSDELTVMTVNGVIPSAKVGKALTHEHILVDFIGAKETGYYRWERANVIRVVTPYLQALKEAGYDSLFECTPAYLGRDPILLAELAAKTGLQIITNTGYYGARENRFLPPEAVTETADDLSDRWIAEWEKGIDGTGIKPGFIKIGIDEGSISPIQKKLVRAAARTHRATGLTIASHTGTEVGAFEELAILADEGISAEAFIWVHAQTEKDLSYHIDAARRGAWISLDGIEDSNVDSYVQIIAKLKASGLIHRVLISQDAGWYSPGEKDGGSFRSYLSIERVLLPALLTNGFGEGDIIQLLYRNPAEAFGIRKRLS
jgi:phosphotriesterase-related protein